MTTSTVIFNHDAAIDEYMAMIILSTMEDVEFAGTVITNADCIAGPAMLVAEKIRTFMARPDLPLSLSAARGWNAFPWAYRGDCIKAGNVGVLRDAVPDAASVVHESGEQWLTDQLENADDNSITMLVNCPLTTLRDVLDTERGAQLAAKIERLIWMGGAIDVPGNLDPATIPPAIANPYAEWNAFWDPPAVDWVFKNTEFPIIVFPLDLTNQAAITPGFLSKLLKQARHSRYSELAFQLYGLVFTEAFYDMWDVATTCFIPHPEFYAPPEPMKLEIVTAGAKEGALVQTANGRPVEVVFNFSSDDGKSNFYDYVLNQLNRQ
jgi:purine nucleosidase